MADRTIGTDIQRPVFAVSVDMRVDDTMFKVMSPEQVAALFEGFGRLTAGLKAASVVPAAQAAPAEPERREVRMLTAAERQPRQAAYAAARARSVELERELVHSGEDTILLPYDDSVTLAALRAYETAEMARLRAAIAAVREIHKPYRWDGDKTDWCEGCFPAKDEVEPWPCPTIRAIEGSEEPVPASHPSPASDPYSVGGGRPVDLEPLRRAEVTRG